MTNSEVDVNTNEQQSHGERFVAPWASGEHLRKIESDVLIPNMVKKKAKVICKDYMDAFSECTKGRTISLAWSCGKELEEMKQCVKKQIDKPELYAECREEYLKKRDNFQNYYVETGKTKDPKRKEALF